MPDALSCERLLKHLSIKQPHTANAMCEQVLGQCRRRQFQDAIRTAESALRLVRADYTMAGIVLLYLSYARMASQSDDQITPMLQDADRAVRLLSLDPFNQAIAYVCRANFELDCETRPSDQSDGDRLARKPQALTYLHRANDLLRQLIISEREYNRLQPVRRCRVLQAMVCQKISGLETSLNADIDLTSTTVPRSPAEPRGKLILPAQLSWPMPESAMKIEIQGSDQGIVPDYFEGSRLTIAGKSYRVLLFASAGLRAGSVQLRIRQPYWMMPLCNDARGRLAIVRLRPRPDRDRQLVAFYDDVTNSALIDQAESATPYTHIQVIGRGRDWLVAETTDHDPIYIGGPYMIGVVEAFLTPE